jgi:hypothetical protein
MKRPVPTMTTGGTPRLYSYQVSGCSCPRATVEAATPDEAIRQYRNMYMLSPLQPSAKFVITTVDEEGALFQGK